VYRIRTLAILQAEAQKAVESVKAAAPKQPSGIPTPGLPKASRRRFCVAYVLPTACSVGAGSGHAAAAGPAAEGGQHGEDMLLGKFQIATLCNAQPR